MSDDTFLIGYGIFMVLLLAGCAYAEYLSAKARDYCNRPEAKLEDLEYELKLQELRNLMKQKDQP